MAPKNVKAYLHNTNFHGIGLDKNSVSMPLYKDTVKVVTAYFQKHKVKELVHTPILESYGRPICTTANDINTFTKVEFLNDNRESIKSQKDLKALLKELNTVLCSYKDGMFVFFDIWTKRFKNIESHEALIPEERTKIIKGEEFSNMQLRKVLCQVSKSQKVKTEVSLKLLTETFTSSSNFNTIEVNDRGGTNYLNITNVGIDCGPPFQFPTLFQQRYISEFLTAYNAAQSKYNVDPTKIETETFLEEIHQAWLTLLKTAYNPNPNSTRRDKIIENWVETNTMDIHRFLKNSHRDVSVMLWKYETETKSITWDYRNRKKLIYDEKNAKLKNKYPPTPTEYIPYLEDQNICFAYTLSKINLNPIQDPNSEIYAHLPSILGTQAHNAVAYTILKNNATVLSVCELSEFDDIKFENNYAIANSVGFIILDVMKKTLSVNETMCAVEFPTYDIRDKADKKEIYYSQIDAITIKIENKKQEYIIWEYKTIWVGHESHLSDALKQAQYYSDVFFKMTKIRVKYIYILLLYVNQNYVVKVNLKKYILKV